MAILASSEGWKLIGPKPIQRRAPLTTMPTCGISTAISKTSVMTNSQGAMRSHQSMRTWNAIRAVSSDRPIQVAWRTTK